MHQLERLSIIVPIHNLKDRTSNLFSWLFSADISEAQVLLVHDTSDNQDASGIRSAIKHYNNIELIEEYCNSPGLARNVGLERAEREYVVFWDFDDLPIINEFKNFFCEFVQSDKKCGVGGYSINVIQAGIMSKAYTREILSNDKRKLMVNPGLWRWIFMRETIGSTRFISSKLAEDQYFLATLEVFDQEIFIWQGAVYRYFVGESNQLTKDRSLENQSLPVAIFFLDKFHQVKPVTKMFCFVAAFRITLYQIFQKRSVNPVVFGLLSRLILRLILSPRLFMLIPEIISTKNSINRRSNERTATVYFFGGLGNQLFQLAFALSRQQFSKIVFIGCSREVELIARQILISDHKFDQQIEFVDQISYVHRKMRNLAIRLSSKKFKHEHVALTRRLIQLFLGAFSVFTPHKGKVHISNGAGFDEKFDFNFTAGNHIFIGYFQSHKWVENTLEAISVSVLELVTKNPEVSELCKEFEKTNPIFVQYRLGDYLDKKNRKLGAVTQKYIVEGIQFLQSSSISRNTIWVFTNDVDKARSLMVDEHLESVFFVSDQFSALETLYLLSQGSRYVISNSTFGWWGAMLSRATHKSVISPNPWFQSIEEPTGLIPSEWRRLRIQD
jgi:hypothetical protein